jgi:hypothetical protein
MVASGLAMVPVPAAAVAGVPVFGLTHDLGNAGGEPSIQDDGQGRLYITTPQGLGSTSSGVLLTRSVDGGANFLPNQVIGGVFGGGDSDIITDVTTQDTYYADLGAVFSTVGHSSDHGATFPTQTQTAPDDDREWLTTIGPTLFLTYHDLAQNIPLIFISTDHGATFSPGGTGGQIIGPGDVGFADAKCNTLVSKPVADANGNLYILTNTSTLAENVAAGCATTSSLDRLYLSVSHDGGHTFTTYLVNDISAATTGKATSGSWGHVFNQLGIDAAGNLYVAASGTLDGSLPLQSYLLVSKDGGKTWSQPIATQGMPNNGQLFPAIAVGQAGQVAVGYYQGLKADNLAAANNFQFFVDQSFNATDPSPTFTHTQLPDLGAATTVHPDGICTSGILCLPGQTSNRNLADFESMTVDPAGNLEVIIPADCDTCQGNTKNWFYKQTAGPLMPPGPTNGNGTGNQTWVAGARTQPPPQPTPSPSAAPLPNTSAARPAERQLPAMGAAIFLAALLIAAVWLAPRRRKTD